jgi:arylformamidase
MTEWLDFTVRLHDGLVHWPDSAPFHRSEWTADSGFVNSRLDFDPHGGTHIDAPRHLIPGAKAADELELDSMIGPAFVLDLRGEGLGPIGRRVLEARIPADATRLLIRSDNGSFWPDGSGFTTEFAALSVDAATWLANRGAGLVGIDYLSIQRFGGDPETHAVLMRADCVIVEGLDLRAADEGWYDLICLPLAIRGAEGSPARVIGRPRS